MFIIQPLKHNKFQRVDIPKPSELYKQFGLTKTMDTSKYSGEDYVAPSQTKVEAAAAATREFEAAAESQDEPKEE